jgi:hypothetical protein
MSSENAVLAYSGVRYHYNRYADRIIDQFWLQLVQVVHHRTGDRWIERTQLVSDDLDRLFWHKLKKHGEFVPTDLITYEWVDPPDQMHKTFRNPLEELILSSFATT